MKSMVLSINKAAVVAISAILAFCFIFINSSTAHAVSHSYDAPKCGKFSWNCHKRVDAWYDVSKSALAAAKSNNSYTRASMMKTVIWKTAGPSLGKVKNGKFVSIASEEKRLLNEAIGHMGSSISKSESKCYLRALQTYTNMSTKSNYTINSYYKYIDIMFRVKGTFKSLESYKIIIKKSKVTVKHIDNTSRVRFLSREIISCS